MEKQQKFTDIEYTNRRCITKREAFLGKMYTTLPWKEWVSLVVTHYPAGNMLQIGSTYQMKASGMLSMP